MKYAIYQRVSTGDQEIDTQTPPCLEWIEKHRGPSDITIVIYSDDNVSSGKKMNKRPALMEMLDELQRGDMVVVFKLDRLSRDIIEMVTIHRMIKEKGASIHSLNDSNADNSFMMGLMGLLAQKEKDDIKLRIHARHNAKKLKGERLSGIIPYGYRLDTETLIAVKKRGGSVVHKPGLLLPVAEEQEVISHMCNLFDEGKTLRDIALELTRMGYSTRDGRQFLPMTLSRILARTGRTRGERPRPVDSRFQEFHLQE